MLNNIDNTTEEFNELIKYINNTLIVEFPSDQIGIEYLLCAILDNTSCRAYKIIDKFVMSDNIEKLRGLYLSYLDAHALKTTNPTSNSYTHEYDLIMSDAASEQSKFNANKIGSEHVLLALINPSNPYSDIMEIFSNMGITYDIVVSQCHISDQYPLIRHVSKTKKLQSSINQLNLDAQDQQTMISQFTTNISELVKKQKCDVLIGREDELNRIIEILSRRKKNNVILIGPSGCGKTQLVHGLAELINLNLVPDNLAHKDIIMLNINDMLSGTSFRGMFEERISTLIKELTTSNKYILFIDDIQSVLKNKQADKDADISSVIENILRIDGLQFIGATTFKEYHKSVESNPGLARKLQKIVLSPSTINETIDIIRRVKHSYEGFHRVAYSNDIIEYCSIMAERYITDKCLPDSALDVIDLCGSQVHFNFCMNTEMAKIKKDISSHLQMQQKYINDGEFEKSDKEEEIIKALKAQLASIKTNTKDIPKCQYTNITVSDVNKAISAIANIPIKDLNASEKEKIANMESAIKQNIVGQDDAVEKVCRIIKRHKVGLGDKTKTLGNVLLCGTSGCGKTLLAKQLAKCVFGSDEYLVRIDMSEYSEKHSVSKLIGSAPGYVGYENGGQLTEAIKNKPNCVLLLDEIEKAHEEVYNIFLQLFDEGHLTDNMGERVNFKNVIVLMTSNVGAKEVMGNKNSFGFVPSNTKNPNSIVESQIKQQFSPEFINRLDQIICFNNLNEENFKSIISLEMGKVASRLKSIGYSMKYTDDVTNYIFEKAWKNNSYGARPIIHTIQDEIEDKLADCILAANDDATNNNIFLISLNNGKLQITRNKQ